MKNSNQQTIPMQLTAAEIHLINTIREGSTLENPRVIMTHLRRIAFVPLIFAKANALNVDAYVDEMMTVETLCECFDKF